MWGWGAARLERTWGILDDYIPYIFVKYESAIDMRNSMGIMIVDLYHYWLLADIIFLN